MSLAFLSDLQPILVKMDISGITKLFKENVRTAHKNIKQVLSNYHKFKIKNQELEELKEKFFIEMVKTKLSVINY